MTYTTCLRPERLGRVGGKDSKRTSSCVEWLILWPMMRIETI